MYASFGESTIGAGASQSLNNFFGLVGRARFTNSATTDITKTAIVQAQLLANSNFTGDITNLIYFEGLDITGDTGGGVTNMYGLKLPAISYGSTENWSIYSEGGNMAHAGNVRIGDTTAPTEALEVNGDIVDLGLTASKPVWTDAGKKLVSKDITPCDVVRTYLTPATQTVTTGTLTSGTVADVQTWMDGNEVHISEVTGSPGFDIEYTFTNVTDFCEILVAFYYVGSGTHNCEVSIYDDTNAVWREIFNQAGAGLSHNTRFTAFPDVANVANYINASDEVKLRFYHPVSGNASHDLYIEYVSIVGTAT